MNPMTMRIVARLMMAEIEREAERPSGKVRRPRARRAAVVARLRLAARRPSVPFIPVRREGSPPAA